MKNKLYQYDLKLLEFINQNRIKAWDHIFIFITDTVTLVTIAIGLGILLYGIFLKNRVLKFNGCLIIGCITINSLIDNILKYSINRERPFINHPFIEKLSTGGSPSFPSGHTTDAFVIAFSITLLFYHNRLVLLLIWIWAFLVAYSRVVLGVHYLSDV